MLGFPVVDPLLPDGTANKLKLINHPPTSELVTLLQKSPPGDEETARQSFEVLSGRGRLSTISIWISFTYCFVEFSQAEKHKLSQMPFIPVNATGNNKVIERLPPIRCYFSGTRGVELYSKLFAFVDFGPRANRFLADCGTKQQPSVEEIAQILLANPRQFYELANGREK